MRAGNPAGHAIPGRSWNQLDGLVRTVAILDTLTTPTRDVARAVIWLIPTQQPGRWAKSGLDLEFCPCP